MPSDAAPEDFDLDDRAGLELARRIARIVGEPALFRHRFVLSMVLQPPASARWRRSR